MEVHTVTTLKRFTIAAIAFLFSIFCVIVVVYPAGALVLLVGIAAVISMYFRSRTRARDAQLAADREHRRVWGF